MAEAEGRGRRTLLRPCLGIAFSLFVLMWITRHVSWTDVGRNLAAFPWWSVLASSAIVLLSLPLRTLQWYWLLGEHEGLTRLQVLRAVCLGHAGNLALPMRGGELVKAGVLARDTKIPLERVLTSVVLCRLQDLIPIGGILLAFFWGVNLAEVEARIGLAPGALHARAPVSLAPETATALGITVVALSLMVTALFLVRKRLVKVAVRNTGRPARGPGRWLGERLGQILAALRSAGNPGRFMAALAAASACWVLFTLAPVPLLLACGIPVFTGLKAALVITGATTFFQMLPSAPMALGTFHAGCTFALLWVHPELGEARALAFSVVLHGVGALSPALPAFFWILALAGRGPVSHSGNESP